MVKYMAVAVAVAVAVALAGAVAVAGLTKRFFNHIQKDFLINVWVYSVFFSASAFDRQQDMMVRLKCSYRTRQPVQKECPV